MTAPGTAAPPPPPLPARAPALRISTPRLVVESVLAGLFTAAGLLLGLAGAVQFLLTALAAMFPCGENALAECRLAHPGTVWLGWGLMIVGPLLCTAVGLLAGALLFVLRRSLAVPVGLGLLTALAAFGAGHHLLHTALHATAPL